MLQIVIFIFLFILILAFVKPEYLVNSKVRKRASREEIYTIASYYKWMVSYLLFSLCGLYNLYFFFYRRSFWRIIIAILFFVTATVMNKKHNFKDTIANLKELTTNILARNAS